MNMLIFSCHSFHILFALCVLFLATHMEAASSSSKVEYLPGFEGPLPFELETGYIGLGESDDDMQVFYYFVKSENNPQKDPLMLWLSGGPGCSSFSGLVNQIGPITIEKKEYNGSIPSLVLRPQSWTKLCNIMFADLPFGTGFSYAKNTTSHRSDRKFVHHVHQFIRKWLIEHPEFLLNEFYVGGDSYAGIPIPAIVQEISNGNGKALQPLINLKSLQQNCKGEYIDVNSKNVLCLRDLQYFDKCISGIKRSHILDHYCEDEPHVWRRSLTQEFKESLSYHLTLPVPDLRCQLYKFYLNEIWANEERVRKALHIREGTIEKWIRCYRNDFEFDITNSVEFHVNLSKKGFRSLIYSGDHDLVVPFLSTQAWIKGLNYSIVDDWRSWLIKDQVAGYTRTYSNQMTFATLKGSGHTGPEYTPEEGFIMFSKWISNTPL